MPLLSLCGLMEWLLARCAMAEGNETFKLGIWGGGGGGRKESYETKY